jgi:hypothetical protein
MMPTDTAATAQMSSQRPTIEVAVIMQRISNTGAAAHWQPWRWELADVVINESGFGTEPRLLYQNESTQRWLHGGLKVELFNDDAEGYYLNATTDVPSWFVLWRMDDEVSVTDVPIPRPQVVSLSYYDAGRWLDAQETVEQVPAPQPVVQWLQAFVDEHHVVEVKRRKRPESFRSLTDRFGNPACVTTEKKFGGGQGGDQGAAHG